MLNIKFPWGELTTKAVKHAPAGAPGGKGGQFVSSKDGGGGKKSHLSTTVEGKRKTNEKAATKALKSKEIKTKLKKSGYVVADWEPVYKKHTATEPSFLIRDTNRGRSFLMTTNQISQMK